MRTCPFEGLKKSSFLYFIIQLKICLTTFWNLMQDNFLEQKFRSNIAGRGERIADILDICMSFWYAPFHYVIWPSLPHICISCLQHLQTVFIWFISQIFCTVLCEHPFLLTLPVTQIVVGFKSRFIDGIGIIIFILRKPSVKVLFHD